MQICRSDLVKKYTIDSAMPGEAFLYKDRVHMKVEADSEWDAVNLETGELVMIEFDAPIKPAKARVIVE